jgi:hypothetical protein
VSQWLNLLIETGFRLERIEEPLPSDEIVRARPEVQDAQVVACFLRFRARGFCARPCKCARVCAFFIQAGFRALKGRIEKGVETRSWPPSFSGWALAEEIQRLAGVGWRWQSGKSGANDLRGNAEIRGTIDEK